MAIKRILDISLLYALSSTMSVVYLAYLLLTISLNMDLSSAVSSTMSLVMNMVCQSMGWMKGALVMDKTLIGGEYLFTYCQ